MSEPQKKRITPTLVREISSVKKSTKRKRDDSEGFWEGDLEDAVGTSKEDVLRAAQLQENFNYWDGIHQRHARIKRETGAVSPKRMGKEKIQTGSAGLKYPFCCPYAETKGPDRGTCVLAYKLVDGVEQDVRCAPTHATRNIRRHLQNTFHSQDEELKELDWVEFS